nr:peptidase T [Lachnospiraceae bacterium]
TSDPDSGMHPSTQRQFDLAKILKKEMEDLGLSDVTLTDDCYLYGYLPGSAGMEDKKTVAFVSHMDTAPDFTGENVNPRIIEDYDGGDVTLSDSGRVLSVADFPELSDLKGRHLIVTDGHTLLGADDKAGIAEILTAVEQITSEGTPHGPVWVCFTPDEEIGEGSDGFDRSICKADYAYTVDGDYEGEVAYENFNAYSAKVTVHGKNVHPGAAKGIMKNAGRIACEFSMRLPLLSETPATTEGREGFYHLNNMQGNVESAVLNYILRDHDMEILEKRMQTLRDIAEEFNRIYGEGTVEVEFSETYRNMIEIMEKHMEVVRLAEEAISSTGLTPISNPVRGGTDGANLSFKGLPCPNLGTGGYGFHGPFEHITTEGMETVVKIVKYIMSHPL